MCALELGRHTPACKHRQMLFGPRPPRGAPPCIPATRLVCSTGVPQQWQHQAHTETMSLSRRLKAHESLGGDYTAV